VRYIYVGLNGGNLTPASADETWRRRYGDCKGKTTLLLALLHELGIDAEAVLVNSSGADDGLDQRLPIPQFFDHVLVRARIDGATYWLDGTLPPVAPPSAQPLFPVTWVLPLTQKGDGLQKLEWRPATTPEDITLFEIDARAGFDKPARIVSTEILRGVKGLQQYVQFSAVTSGQLLDVFRQRAVGDVWQAIDDVQWRYDQKAGASILTISGAGKVNWHDDGGGARSLALPGGGFSPPERRVRSTDQDQSVPFYAQPEYSCHVTTVRLPLSTQARQWSSKASYDTRLFGRNYYRAWELRDGSIRMVRGSRTEQPEIDADTARRDNERIAAFDNSMGYIFYNPSSESASVGNGEKVPAAYDFDWTASDVPCASPQKVIAIAPQLTKKDAEDYIISHPDIFINRKIFVVDQIRMPRVPLEILKKLEPLNTLEEVEALLTKDNIPHQRGEATLDAVGADPQLVAFLLKLPPNEVFVLPGDGGLLVDRIKETKVVPFTGDQANQFATTWLARTRTQNSDNVSPKPPAVPGARAAPAAPAAKP
jgi:hypothetical protein